MNAASFVRPLVLALCLAGPGRAADVAPGIAPDGHGGLGQDTELSELLRFVRTTEDGARAFLGALLDLEADVSVQVASLEESYRKRGLFALLGRRAEPDLAALHRAFTEAEERAWEVLAGDPDRAAALAEMLLDTRFRVRIRLIDGWRVEAHELRSGLALLRAATDGYVQIDDQEGRNIATRVDLAASRLRALRQDLEALRPVPGSTPSRRGDSAEELLALARRGEAEERRAAIDAVVARERSRAESMSSALFTTRLHPRVAALLEWRQGSFAQAAPLKVQALQFLADPELDGDVPPEIAALEKHDRMRRGAWRARQGMAFDPFDEDLAWAAAHGTDFLWGALESRALYDRFLALRGIRAHDAKTLRGRDLTAREKEALAAIQNPFQPDRIPPSDLGGGNGK